MELWPPLRSLALSEAGKPARCGCVQSCPRVLRVPLPSLTRRFSPERCVEDHELVAQVDSTMAGESKFLFRKNYGKYEFFKNPNVSPASSAWAGTRGFMGAEQSITGPGAAGSGQGLGCGGTKPFPRCLLRREGDWERGSA